MPLPKYSVEPVKISNFPVPQGVESELEFISNVTLCNLMRQMASICQLSGSMFEELTKELTNTTERAMRLQKRIENLSADVQPLKAADEDCSLTTGVEMMEFQSKKPTSSQVINKNTIPMSMRKFYEAAEPAPAIHLMDNLRDDGRIGMKMYSDPSFFFDLWSHEMLLSPNKQKKPKKKKPKQHKVGKAAKQIHENNNEGEIQIQQQGLGGVVEDDYTRNYNQIAPPIPHPNGAPVLLQEGYVTPGMPLPTQQNQFQDQYCFIQPDAAIHLSNASYLVSQKQPHEARNLRTPVDMHEDLPPAPQAPNGAGYRMYPSEEDITPSPPPPPMPSNFESHEASFNAASPGQWLSAASNSLGSLIGDLPPLSQRLSMGSSDDLLLPPPPAPNGADVMPKIPSPAVPEAPKAVPVAPPAPPPPPPAASAGAPKSAEVAAAPAGPPQDLLSAIRQGMVLRKVSVAERQASISGAGNTGTLSRHRDVQAIFDAVAKRRQMMKQGSDSDSDSDEDSDKSSGWSD